MRHHFVRDLIFFSLIVFFAVHCTVHVCARPFVLVLSQDDLKDSAAAEDALSDQSDSGDWDDFGDSDAKSEDELDPGSWRPVLDPSPSLNLNYTTMYYSGLAKMVGAVSSGEPRLMEEAAAEIEAAAEEGDPHAQSVMGFLYGSGQARERNLGKAHLYHHFAAEGGNLQSKMALAYTYSRQDVSAC